MADRIGKRVGGPAPTIRSSNGTGKDPRPPFPQPPDRTISTDNGTSSAKPPEVPPTSHHQVGQITVGIAHDLNNMLAAILGYATLAGRELADLEVVREHLDAITTATRRAQSLTRRVMRIAAAPPAPPTRVRVTEVVDEVLRLVRPSFGPGVTTTLDNRAGNDEIATDEPALYRALLNICTNACEALGNGGGSIDVTITSTTRRRPGQHRSDASTTDYIRIAITDSGPGMSRALAAQAVAPGISTKRHDEHAGLGLAIASGAVRAATGFLEIDTIEGNGTSVAVFLPILAPSDQTEVSC